MKSKFSNVLGCLGIRVRKIAWKTVVLIVDVLF